MANDLIRARLVYDGGDVIYVPPEMGTPREDQLQGTVAEQLSELAGRVCYDSLGKGRPSFTQEVATGDDPHTGEQLLETVEGYHDHIRKVGHFSVCEHFNATIRFWDADLPIDIAYRLCCNRPGVWMVEERSIYGDMYRITANLRSVYEWFNWSQEVGITDDERYSPFDRQIGLALRNAFGCLAPHIIDPLGERELVCSCGRFQVVEPASDHERWVSMFVSGSRGMSHELVRHGDFTGISQRSSRFCDEAESPWVVHPLESEFANNMDADDALSHGCDSVDVIGNAQCLYRQLVGQLEPWLISRGVDRTTARKQARGAARGYLGNALYTELIFSASVAQWKRILRQRASVFADAEIRELACKCLAELKRSRYGDRFADWRLNPSPDGIGEVAVESHDDPIQEPLPCLLT